MSIHELFVPTVRDLEEIERKILHRNETRDVSYGIRPDVLTSLGFEIAERGIATIKELEEEARRVGVELTPDTEGEGEIPLDDREKYRRALALFDLGISVPTIELFVTHKVFDPEEFLGRYRFAISGTLLNDKGLPEILSQEEIPESQAEEVDKAARLDPTHVTFLRDYYFLLPRSLKAYYEWAGRRNRILQIALPAYSRIATALMERQNTDSLIEKLGGLDWSIE